MWTTPDPRPCNVVTRHAMHMCGLSVVAIAWWVADQFLQTADTCQLTPASCGLLIANRLGLALWARGKPTTGPGKRIPPADGGNYTGGDNGGCVHNRVSMATMAMQVLRTRLPR